MATNARVTALAQSLDFTGIESRHGLPAGILTNLITQESGGNVGAVSRTGARGIAQFMPATARAYNVDVNDPRSSAEGAARFLEDLMDQFNGDVSKAIAAYNCGPGGVRRAMSRAGANGDWRNFLPAETKHYLEVVGGGLGSGSASRVASGSGASPADLEAEEARRRRRAVEAGIDPSLVSTDELMGQLFFALVRSFLERRVNTALSDSPNAASRQYTTTPQELDNEFGAGTSDRVNGIKARSAANGFTPKPIPGETSAPQPGNGDLGAMPPQTSLPRVAFRTTPQPTTALG